MKDEFNASLPAFYDDWSRGYADTFFNELDGKPRDRELLDLVVQRAAGGRICDLGCGPGHIARFMSVLGANVQGMDISEGMVEIARQRSPEISFMQGSFYNIQADADSFAAVVAFYSLIHARRDRLGDVFTEIARVLEPNGIVLASFHEGEGEIFKQDVAFNFFSRDEIFSALKAASLELELLESREGYEIENGTWPRLYVIARKAG
ncbi:MAG: class I SAM-dependent methyltransferase [Pseudomonadales bacterium]|nr:class I SAM-dependent methyltransferase [Pseudomonadales bacterium]